MARRCPCRPPASSGRPTPARCRLVRKSSATRSTTFRQVPRGRAASASSPTWTHRPWRTTRSAQFPARLPRPALLPCPGGIKYGQHWLNVKFEKSLVRVPFRILTEEEEKLLSKNYKDISKQVEEAFKNPK